MSVWKDRCLLYGVRKQREGTGRAGEAVTQVGTAGKVQFQSEQGILDSFEFCNDDWWISICTLRLILKGDQRANKPTKSHVSGQVQFFSSFCGALNTLSSAYCTFRWTWINGLEHHQLLLSCLRIRWNNFVRNCSLGSCLWKGFVLWNSLILYKVSLLSHSLFFLQTLPTATRLRISTSCCLSVNTLKRLAEVNLSFCLCSLSQVFHHSE